MNIQPILEYQKLDSELFKIEKNIRESKNKVTASQMFDSMKQAQERSHKLEEKAGGRKAEYRYKYKSDE